MARVAPWNTEDASSQAKEIRTEESLLSAAMAKWAVCLFPGSVRAVSDRILARIYCLVNHLVAANLLQGELTALSATPLSSSSSFFHLRPPPVLWLSTVVFHVSFPLPANSLYSSSIRRIRRCILSSNPKSVLSRKTTIYNIVMLSWLK